MSAASKRAHKSLRVVGTNAHDRAVARANFHALSWSDEVNPSPRRVLDADAVPPGQANSLEAGDVGQGDTPLPEAEAEVPAQLLRGNLDCHGIKDPMHHRDEPEYGHDHGQQDQVDTRKEERHCEHGRHRNERDHRNAADLPMMIRYLHGNLQFLAACLPYAFSARRDRHHENTHWRFRQLMTLNATSPGASGMPLEQTQIAVRDWSLEPVEPKGIGQLWRCSSRPSSARYRGPREAEPVERGPIR